MREMLDLNHNVVVIFGDKSAFDMPLNEFRNYCLGVKDLTLCPELLKKEVVKRGSVTYILEQL
jgi:hypothetical protein